MVVVRVRVRVHLADRRVVRDLRVGDYRSRPAFLVGFFVVFAGQILVAFVFAALVSRWPIEGSIYQWSRRLLGNGFGWFAGWAYTWTLIIAMATVALGAAGFIANIAGIDSPTGTQRASIAFVILLCGTALNLIGRQALKVFMTASIIAEVIGSVGLGTWLLLFHRHNSLSVLFHGAGAEGASYFSLSGPFLVAVAFIGFSFVGFESAGAIAEEVHEPRKNLPKAVIFSLVFIAAVVIYASLAIILAIPDLSAVANGTVADPVSSTLTAALGTGIAKPVEVLFVIGFLASFLALQTSASRLIWAFARDRALPGSQVLSLLSTKQRLPRAALLITTLLGAVLFLLSKLANNLYTIMVNFSAGGFFLAFLFPLVGFSLVQARRRWSPGPVTLGRGSMVLTVIATIWVIFEFLNIAWPRKVYPERYLDWSVWIMIAVLGVIGGVVYGAVRPRIISAAVIDGAEQADEMLDAQVVRP